MSSPDWQDLERLWQSSSEAAQAKDLVVRLHRRPWLRKLTIALEIVLSIVLVGVGIHVMLRDRPFAVVNGIVVLILAACGAGVTLWARLAPKASAEESVTAAIDTAIYRVRVRVRLALGSLWLIGVSLLSTAFFAVLWAQLEAYTTRRVHSYLFAFAFLGGWLGLVQLLTIPYYLRRVRELQQLEQIRRELQG